MTNDSIMPVYLDNAATTKVAPQVFEAMKPYLTSKFGNSSSVHYLGQETKISLDQSRKKIAAFFSVKPGEVIFTSCATEAINLGHKGLIEAISRQFSVARNQSSVVRHQSSLLRQGYGGQAVVSSQTSGIRDKFPHIITSSVEHKAVLETCQHLEKSKQAEVTYLPVDRFGLVDLADLEKAIKPKTVLVSIMYVNNEVGTIQPIEKISQLIKKVNVSRVASHVSPIYLHTDATQAIGYLDCRLNKLGVDLLSFSGHKFQAPKGIGALLVKEGTPLVRQQDGGSQENNFRAGTENVAFIVGLAEALELVTSHQKSAVKEMEKLRDELIKGVLVKIPGSQLTGHPTERAPHIASFVIKGVEGEAILLLLSEAGIAASSGSACTSGLLKPSHVLTAMGISAELAHGSLRLSLSKENTHQEVDYVLKVLPMVVAKLRKMAPKLVTRH